MAEADFPLSNLGTVVQTAGVGVQTVLDGGIAFTTHGGSLKGASGLGDFQAGALRVTATLGGVLNVGSRSGSTFATTNVDPSFLPPIHDPIDVTLAAV